MSIAGTILVALFMAQDAGQEKIDECIRLLGDEAIETREQAQNELLKIGAPAAASLRRAAKDPDLERASRASAVLVRIEGKKKRTGAIMPQPSKAASGDEDDIFEDWILNPGGGRILRLRMRHLRIFDSWFWPFWELVESHGI